MVVAEGNIFLNIAEPVEAGYAGQLFSSPSAEDNAVCEAAMGHVCEVNSLKTSGAFDGVVSEFLASLEGHTIASAEPFSAVEAVKASAGFGTI